jgi:hypothetical protein
MKAVLESSFLDIKEKVVVLGVLSYGSQSTDDIHNYTSLSRAMLEKICGRMVDNGYFDLEHNRGLRYPRRTYKLTNKLFEQHNSGMGKNPIDLNMYQ